MLRKIGNNIDLTKTTVTAASAVYPTPFETGLEFAPPARGTWNIVHVGMLIPESHQIFVCAAGCLRGVVLTAAEMGATDRFSTIEIRENNVIDGDMEELIIDGVTDIINKLPHKPKAILIYTSCIHHFMSCDVDRCFKVLKERFGNIDFIDCYMNPIMRKSGLTPDQLMRRQLYALLKPIPEDHKSVNILGNVFPTDRNSEIASLIENSGYTIRDITQCSTYNDYLMMSASFLNICTYPSAKCGGEFLSKRLIKKYIYLPFAFDYEEIDNELIILAEALGVSIPDTSKRKTDTDNSVQNTLSIIGKTPIAIDYTAVSRPLQLAKFLTSHGYNVTDVFLDAISVEDKSSLSWLKENHPKLKLHPTVHPEMRFHPKTDEKIIAIGQKAAYFTGTDLFVNIVEDGGLHGYEGIINLSSLILDAYINPKEAKRLIQIKGLGCNGGCTW